MNAFTQLFHNLRRYLDEDFTVSGLRLLIILWAIAVIITALIVDNPWILAGIAAYEMLP